MAKPSRTVVLVIWQYQTGHVTAKCVRKFNKDSANIWLGDA